MKIRIISAALIVITLVSLFSISTSAATRANDTWYYDSLVTSAATPYGNDTVYLPKDKTYTIKVCYNSIAGGAMTKQDKKTFETFVNSCYFTANIYTDTNKFVKSYTNLKVGSKIKMPKNVKKYRVDIIKHFSSSAARKNFIKNNHQYIGYCIAKA